MDWIELAQALVNAVINLRIHKMRGISSLAENCLSSEEGICSME
jgi:tRNA-binding EMAP/Myf-like protein